MTAMNAFRAEDAVHLFTDAAHYEGGRLTGIGSKLHHFPNIPAVLVVSGNIGHGVIVERLLSGMGYRTFEALSEALPAALVQMAGHPYACGADRAPWRALLVGMAGNGPSIMHVLAPGDGKCHWQAAGSAVVPDPGDGLDFDQLDPERSGLSLMQAQRRNCRDATGAFVIGGFCLHTVVSRDGIASKVLWTWPDRIGGPIDPECS